MAQRPIISSFCAYENLVLSCDGSLFIDEDKDKNYILLKYIYAVMSTEEIN